MDFNKIIITPYQTEKTYAQQTAGVAKYAFIVDPSATKSQISLAFQSIYNLTPASVATQIRKPVKVRTGTAKPGYSKKFKIAYITLAPGQSFENPTTSETPVETAPVSNENVSVEEVKVNESPIEVEPSEAEQTEVVLEELKGGDK